MSQNPSNPAKQEFTDILLSVNFDTQDEVLKKETGLKIAKKIYGAQITSDTDLNFFAARAKRWNNLVKWATGTQDTKEFLSYLNVVDATKAYLNIDMSPVMLGAQFVGTLVESMAKNEEYPCVTAVDDGSMTEKETRQMEALFRMHNAEDIVKAEEAAGFMLEQPNAYVPENELAAEVYFKLEDRLPKEIEYEQRLEANALKKSKYQRVLKPKLYFDAIVNNFGATKIESDYRGGYKIRKVAPANAVYSYFQNDTGEDEIGYFGEVYSLKIKDIRTRYGKSKLRPNGLTEKQIFDMAKQATQQNVGTNFAFEWKNEFQDYTHERAWDEHNIPVFDFEIQICVNDYSVIKKDRYGKENIAPKKGRPAPTSDKATVAAKEKKRWYRGVYAIYGNEMLYWGLPDIVLFPFMNIAEGMSSYSVVIPFNQGTYAPSLFERALEPMKEYTLAKLKRKQLIAKLRPSNIRIDVESARNVTLGNGQTISWEEILRIFDQTGAEIYSSRGVNPNERENPAISTGATDDSLQKIAALTETMNASIIEIRQLLGVPMYRDGSDVGDRTAAKLAEMQSTSSYNVTDHIPNAINQLMEETLYKCCILEWQKAVKENDTAILSTEFEVAVHMKPTEYQKKLLEQRILQWSQTPDKYGNPLLSPKDVLYIENIKDFKLAQWYLANIIETNRNKHMEEAAKLDKQNQENQIASSQAATEGAKQLEQMKAELEIAKVSAADKAKQKQTIIAGVFDLLKVGGPIPEGFQPLVKLVVENHAMPLMQENKQIVQGIQQQEVQEQEAAAQEEMIMQASEETGLPPEQIIAQMQGGDQQQVA
jgi:hypothetical protein